MLPACPNCKKTGCCSITDLDNLTKKVNLSMFTMVDENNFDKIPTIVMEAFMNAIGVIAALAKYKNPPLLVSLIDQPNMSRRLQIPWYIARTEDYLEIKPIPWVIELNISQSHGESREIFERIKSVIKTDPILQTKKITINYPGQEPSV